MSDRRALAIVCVVPVICWLACWPFADVGVNDDWGYAWTVKRLLETGGLRYNGWIAPIVAPQAAWGALWALAFGFSHDVLRVSTLPLSIACAALAYRLHRLVGIVPKWATFATLLLVTSPLFTPWSASFMTDVPSLALTLALFCAIVGLARARDAAAVARQTAAVAVLGVIGGLNRQSLFVFAGVALAIELARRVRRYREAAVVSFGLATLVASTVAALWWHRQQPYAVTDLSPPIDHPLRSIVSMSGLALSLAFYLAPLGIACARLGHTSLRLRAAIAVACLTACVGVRLLAPESYAARFAIALWSGNTLTANGLLFDAIDAPGDRPVLFDPTTRAVMAGGVFWLIALAAVEAWRARQRIVETARRVACDRARPAVAALASMGVIVAVYAALLFPRAGLLVIFDRYLLAVMPVASLALLMAARRRLRGAGPGIAAWAALAVYALVGVGVTFDHFIEMRGRLRIVDALMRRGVPRTAIANGFAFDSWTQLEATGYINDPQVTNPPGAYRPDPRHDERERYFWFLPRTPAVQPRWIIVNATHVPQPLGDRRAYAIDHLMPPGTTYLIAWPTRLGVPLAPATRPAPAGNIIEPAPAEGTRPPNR